MLHHNRYESDPLEAVPQLLAPMAYHKTFNWGSLQVTEQAHDAYEMMPLAVVEAGGVGLPRTPFAQGEPRVDIVLAGPEEHTEEPVSGRLWGDVGIHNRGTAMVFGYSEDKATQREAAIKQVIAQVRHTLNIGESATDAEILSIVTVGDEEIPFTDAIDHIVVQGHIHHFAEVTRHLVEEAQFKWWGSTANRTHLVHLRNLAVLNTVGVGPAIVAGAEITKSATGMLLFPSLWTAVSGTLIMRSVIAHIKSAPKRNAVYRQMAEVRAATVSGDIHDMYCASHFNRQYN